MLSLRVEIEPPTTELGARQTAPAAATLGLTPLGLRRRFFFFALSLFSLLSIYSLAFVKSPGGELAVQKTMRKKLLLSRLCTCAELNVNILSRSHLHHRKNFMKSIVFIYI